MFFFMVFSVFRFPIRSGMTVNRSGMTARCFELPFVYQMPSFSSMISLLPQSTLLVALLASAIGIACSRTLFSVFPSSLLSVQHTHPPVGNPLLTPVAEYKIHPP